MTHSERELLLAIARHLIAPKFDGWGRMDGRDGGMVEAIRRVESERSCEKCRQLLPCADHGGRA